MLYFLCRRYFFVIHLMLACELEKREEGTQKGKYLRYGKIPPRENARALETIILTVTIEKRGNILRKCLQVQRRSAMLGAEALAGL